MPQIASSQALFRPQESGPSLNQWLSEQPPDPRATLTIFARQSGAGGRVLVVGPIGEPDAHRGLTLPEQLGEIPDSFNGYIWVEDIWNLGPSLRPSRERRSVDDQLAGQAAVERRRAASN